ncbi:hypothetical protein [Bosea sp. PAMC 26642]|uniref:hypothetical protein n=1 Tax=Bosea sp. (strain PAMC 26642) TaxID=1792307 RepID=UPI00076FECCD|nr:hypothetical protein [Bosea sp. PAMC 26642]AMJ62530.1 hypothetical protein AXW83_21470 [Bosea sp. PAMC 26642]
MGETMIIDVCGEQPAHDARERRETLSMPPFWELEQLIAGGCDLETALSLMSARRSCGSIASRWLSAGTDSFPLLMRLAS